MKLVYRTATLLHAVLMNVLVHKKLLREAEPPVCYF